MLNRYKINFIVLSLTNKSKLIETYSWFNIIYILSVTMILTNNIVFGKRVLVLGSEIFLLTDCTTLILYLMQSGSYSGRNGVPFFRKPFYF